MLLAVVDGWWVTGEGGDGEGLDDRERFVEGGA